jgi:hypothetical protein
MNSAFVMKVLNHGELIELPLTMCGQMTSCFISMGTTVTRGTDQCHLWWAHYPLQSGAATKFMNTRFGRYLWNMAIECDSSSHLMWSCSSISFAQTIAKVGVSRLSDEELEAIIRNAAHLSLGETGPHVGVKCAPPWIGSRCRQSGPWWVELRNRLGCEWLRAEPKGIPPAGPYPPALRPATPAQESPPLKAGQLVAPALRPSSRARREQQRRCQRPVLLYGLTPWHLAKMPLDSAACPSSGAAWPLLLSPDAFGGDFEDSESSVWDSAELSFVP